MPMEDWTPLDTPSNARVMEKLDQLLALVTRVHDCQRRIERVVADLPRPPAEEEV